MNSALPTFHQPALENLLQCAQPLIFEVQVDGKTMYSGSGTLFYVLLDGRGYAVGTRHSLKPEAPEAICLLPNDTSLRLLRHGKAFFVPAEDEGDAALDVVVTEFDLGHTLGHPETASVRLIDLSQAVPDLLPPFESLSLAVLGFPDEVSEIDYVEEIIHRERRVLHCTYEGVRDPSHIHAARVTNEHGLSSFSGFSGGPVFGWRKTAADSGEVVLCGMATHGTVASGLVHFLSSETIIAAILASRDYETRNQPAASVD